MPYDYENPFDPQQEAAKRDEILNRIKSWWSGIGPMSPQDMQAIQQRQQAAQQTGLDIGRKIVSPLTSYLQGVGGQPQPQPQQAPPPPPSEPTQVARPQYTPDYGYTPMGPPPMVPQAQIPGPPPPQQQQSPQMAGTPGVDPVAYMQQREQEKQAKHMQMVQMVNTILGEQGDKKESRREKMNRIGAALIPLSGMLTQFGGAMMSPAWMRGQMMANMGQHMPAAMLGLERARDTKEYRKEQQQNKALSIIPQLIKAEEGKEPTPHFLVGKDGQIKGVYPGPISQEKQESQARSFQAAAVDAYNKGDTATGDWYTAKANEIAKANLALREQQVQQGWARVGQGQQRLDRPQMLYDTEQDELIQSPPGTRPLPRQRQQGSGGIRDILAEGGQGGIRPPAQPPRPPRPGMKWQWVPD